jgi:pyruvate kinase
MVLRPHKTKIIATIGPACESSDLLTRMITAGMDVARLNFSHGALEGHRQAIGNIRAASLRAGRRVAVMADLPGPKMRIGRIAEEPLEVKVGDRIVLTAGEADGSAGRISMSFERLPEVVGEGDVLFLNDGFIEIVVEGVAGGDVHCRVEAGGELRSRKGLNLPGIDLGMSAFTDHDRECLLFALEHGVDAVSQSFVETAADVRAVERAGALDHLEGILEEADGIMVARGDLGVEVPIEKMAVLQKEIMAEAVRKGKPVITATQMLESMTVSRRPTRAEATDVANAVLDGTDGVMLSGESATGKYPVEAVEMLARIAAATEPHRSGHSLRETLDSGDRRDEVGPVDLIALSVQHALERVMPAAVIVPTVSGYTARNIARFRLPVWVTAISPREETCRELLFSYGVHPVCEPERPGDWNAYARDWAAARRLEGDLAILTEGPSPRNPEANHRMELVDLR